MRFRYVDSQTRSRSAANSHAASGDGHQHRPGQIGCVTVQQFNHRLNLLIDAELDNPNNWPMWMASDEDEFAEILVLCDQNAALAKRQLQQLLVTGLGVDRKRRHDIVPSVQKKGFESARRRAGIEQEFHEVPVLAIRS